MNTAAERRERLAQIAREMQRDKPRARLAEIDAALERAGAARELRALLTRAPLSDEQAFALLAGYYQVRGLAVPAEFRNVFALRGEVTEYANVAL